MSFVAPSKSFNPNTKRKSVSMELLSSTLMNGFDFETQLPPVTSLRCKIGNEKSKLPILKRPTSLQHLNETAKVETRHGSGPSNSYSSVLSVTNERLVLLMNEVLALLAYLEIPNAPTSVAKYKALFVDQYLGICTATLSKIVNVKYGLKKDETIGMILYVTKALQCPIRISKLQLLNPMSSSSFKICTLFLHWICCRAWAFVSQSRTFNNNELSNSEKTLFDIFCNFHSSCLESGMDTQTNVQSRQSVYCTALSQLGDLSAHASQGKPTHDELEKDNTELEKKLDALLNKNEGTRRRISHQKSQLEEMQRSVPDPQIVAAKKLRLRFLREEIAAKQREMMEESDDSSLEDEQQPAPESTHAAHAYAPEDVEKYRARLDELEIEGQHLLLKVKGFYNRKPYKF